MINILGIDYGRKKIGVALATSMLAEAYEVVRYEKVDEAIKRLKEVVEKENVKKIVFGISEGRMAEETKQFAKKIEKELKVKVSFQDETLSTKLAQELAIEANVKRKKRREFEDAFTAAVILQDYLNLRGKL